MVAIFWLDGCQNDKQNAQSAFLLPQAEIAKQFHYIKLICREMRRFYAEVLFDGAKNA